MKFELIAFDIDGTLTRSKQALEQDLADLICQLLEKYKVAIISGASYKQFEWQILSGLNCDVARLGNLYLLPVDGTLFCQYENDWKCEEDAPLSEEEKKYIREAFENIFEKSGLDKPDKIYGELVEDRSAQLNFSALGQDAPVELKEKWDPDNKKRRKMIEVIAPVLPGYSMHIGGTTSIEITKVGVDKAYGIKKLIKMSGIPKEKILYVGDRLFKGGNDEPVLTLGVECRAVKNPEETKKVILELFK
ncbi:MAG: HAD-IIB family hydrolase [Parcubacteria group bacterium]